MNMRLALLYVVLLAAPITLVSCTVDAEAPPAVVAQDAEADQTIFDGYLRGVHAFELVVEGVGDEMTFTARKKDLPTNAWGRRKTLAAREVKDKEEFRFEGTLADFAVTYPAVAGASWRGNTAVAWADGGPVYRRHSALDEEIDGELASAFYWAVPNGNAPTDYIIGADNSVIAAIDPSNDYVLVRRGYEDFTTVKHWRDPSVSQPLYGYKALDLQMIPTRAGPRLATRVYLPDGDIEGPFPAILIRTPYGITDLIRTYEHYAVRGFAVVLQASRGTIHWDPESRSEGPHQEFTNETPDGADALNWITAQDWSDGQICMEGSSYRGYTQWMASMARNPALKCLIPESSMGSAFSDQPYMGGTFVQGLAYYKLRMLNKKLLPERTWPDVFRHRPIADIDRYATGEDIPVWNRMVEHASNDAYWKVQDFYAGDHDRDFGTLQISGWFDDDYPGTRSNWALMAKHGTQPNRLLLGPWRHGYNRDRQVNSYGFGAASMRPDVWLLKQKWYDHFLKGVKNGVTDPKVEYFLLGANEWRTADAWPPREARVQPWYFHSTGRANAYVDDGGLNVTAPTGQEPAENYVYDPRNAVKNWYTFDLMEQWADYQSYPYDFKDIETRQDVITYTSAVLDEDVTIAGDIKVVLYASTDVKDTDWWAYLSDVSPDNGSHRLSVGALRARFRNLDDPDYHVFGSNFETEELLSGDIEDVVRYEISIPSVANTFKKGHRIRIAVMNAHENYSFPNSNTGGHEAHVIETKPGSMRVHHSAAHPSHVLLPVLKSE